MREPRRVGKPPEKPLLLFDGDCGFCKRWVERWKSLTGHRVDYAPSQEAGPRFPEIAAEEFRRSVQLVLPDGRVFDGAEAVFVSLSFAPRRGWLLTAYRNVPGLAAVTEFAYGVVARHRTAASAVTSALWGMSVERPSYRLSNTLFLRLLGLCYLAAFLSLWVQVDGLIGSRGITPARDLLEAARSQLGGERWTVLPTLSWLNASDGFLHFLCGAGTLAALLAAAGLVPVRALLLWLLFRLMFSSGFFKLASGDPNWRNLTALTYHYWTQPLPPWTAWFVSHSPIWFHKFSCFVMFAVELGAPLLIVAPRRLRLIACGV